MPEETLPRTLCKRAEHRILVRARNFRKRRAIRQHVFQKGIVIEQERGPGIFFQRMLKI